MTFPNGPILSVSSQAAREPSPDPRADNGAQPTAHDAEQVGPSGSTAQIPVDGHMPGPGGMYQTGFMDGWK